MDWLSFQFNSLSSSLRLYLHEAGVKMADDRRICPVRKRLTADWKIVVNNSLKLLSLLMTTTFFSRLLFHRGLDEANVIMLYLLTVFIISRWTTGYLYGIVSSVLCVFLFNFFFTEPFYTLNVTDTKYPLIFAVMLAVSLLTSAMTVQLQKTSAEKIRLAEIEAQNRQALASEKLRGTILRSISHDLRTPLTSISGSISVLLENPDLPEVDRKKLLNDVYGESVWLSRFVENLLSLTRIDDNLLKLNLQPEMIEEVVGETVSIVRRRIGNRRLVVDVADNCGLVDMDAGLIEQVLINLIDNAISHTSDNGRIEIHTHCEGANAVFSVGNDGPGINASEINRIFDRYFVGSEERSDARRGMGMGLSICESIVKAHRGEIRVASPDEGGVLFTFKLPIKGESK